MKFYEVDGEWVDRGCVVGRVRDHVSEYLEGIKKDLRGDTSGILIRAIDTAVIPFTLPTRIRRFGSWFVEAMNSVGCFPEEDSEENKPYETSRLGAIGFWAGIASMGYFANQGYTGGVIKLLGLANLANLGYEILRPTLKESWKGLCQIAGIYETEEIISENYER